MVAERCVKFFTDLEEDDGGGLRENSSIWKEHAMPKDQKEGHLMLSVLGSLCVLDTKPLLAND